MWVRPRCLSYRPTYGWPEGGQRGFSNTNFIFVRSHTGSILSCELPPAATCCRSVFRATWPCDSSSRASSLPSSLQLSRHGVSMHRLRSQVWQTRRFRLPRWTRVRHVVCSHRLRARFRRQRFRPARCPLDSCRRRYTGVRGVRCRLGARFLGCQDRFVIYGPAAVAAAAAGAASGLRREALEPRRRDAETQPPLAATSESTPSARPCGG